MSRKCSAPRLCPFWHSSTQINAIMIKPEASLILKEKFFSCTCQVVESGVAGLFSGFRTHPVNTLVCILVFEESSNFLILNLVERQERQCGKTLLSTSCLHLEIECCICKQHHSFHVLFMFQALITLLIILQLIQREDLSMRSSKLPVKCLQRK